MVSNCLSNKGSRELLSNPIFNVYVCRRNKASILILYRQHYTGKLILLVPLLLVFFFQFIEFHSLMGTHRALNSSSSLKTFPLDCVYKNNITLFLNILMIFEF